MMPSKRSLIVLVMVIAAVVAMGACKSDKKSGTSYPSAGEDVFENTTATVHIELTPEGVSAAPLRQELETIELQGPARITRGDPEKDGDVYVVRTEIVEMELTGTASFGNVIVRESADKQSTGEVRQKVAGEDFPADSFFDVFVDVEVPGLDMTLHNEEPMHMTSELHDLPPAEDDSYMGEDDRPLYTPAGLQVGRIVDARHIPNPEPPPSGTEEPTEPSTAEPLATATPPEGGEEVTVAQNEGCEHTQPGVESELQKLVAVDDAEGNPVEGAQVSASATGPGLLSPTAQGTTDAGGQAELAWAINRFGEYIIHLEGVQDAQGQALSMSSDSEIDATFTVGEVCATPESF